MAESKTTRSDDRIRLTDVAIVLHPEDCAAVACRDLEAGEVFALDHGRFLTVADRIPLGHKVALRPTAAGRTLLKYGQPIGRAGRDIHAGEHIHRHNVLPPEQRDSQIHRRPVPQTPRIDEPKRTFQGFLREDGRVGTRNYLAVIGSANCSASVCRAVADRFGDVRKEYPNIDGVIALTHKTGCGMPADGENLSVLRRTVAGMAGHPNVAASLLIGLGCEVNQIEGLEEFVRIGQGKHRPRGLTIQMAGGVTRTVETAVRTLSAELPHLNALQRTTQPADKLVLGTECGGSDSASGITANPAVGDAADRLVRQGGTVVLAETPEISGAEHLLVERSVSDDVAASLLGFVRWWSGYAQRWGCTLQQNLTHGNYAGGLTTIAEKSLGAVAKGGTSPLTNAYAYAERIATPGLVFMDTPGHDPVSVTGMVAGGCNLVVFTTGRGSVFGCKPTPSLKICSNTVTYERMAEDMDLNAGTILDGEPVASVGERIFEELLAVASGKPTRSERLRIGEEEFAPWDIGPFF